MSTLPCRAALLGTINHPRPPPTTGSRLKYELTVDSKLIQPTSSSDSGADAVGAAARSPEVCGAHTGSTSWEFFLESRRFVIEYDHRTSDIFLNNVKIEAEGKFAETDDEDEGSGSGSKHVFPIPPSMDTAVLCVQPAAGGRGPPALTLDVNGERKNPIAVSNG